ncbi:MAG: carboxypeptidase regulatory-like domain-containing protein [Verrucomicrobiota bacterium]
MNGLVSLAVLPGLILMPCHGFEILLSLPTEVSASISDSLLPDRSGQRDVAGEGDPDSAILWDPVVTPWAWSELDPAWQPVGQPEPPETFLAFWEASPSVFPSQVVTPLLPVVLQAEEAEGDGMPVAEVGPGLEPGDQNDAAWVPPDADGAVPAEAAEDPVAPRERLLVEQEVGECTIKGEVYDKASLDPIRGAIVTVAGTPRSDETDAEGRFEIGGLPSGDYTVNILALDYSILEMPASPRPDSPATLRVGLTIKPTDDGDGEFILPEETVVGEYVESSQGDFNLSLVGEAPKLAAGINRDEFKKSAVSDAGEAIAKVSGANIVDGKYAVVRGLADRYVTTTFNGGQIASADPSRKAVQLDLFPTNVIESIVVDKTFSPHLAGDFGGGAIDIITRAFPEERILDFKFKLTYNDALEDTIYTVPHRSLGTFGDLGLPMPSSLEVFAPNGDTEGFLDRTTSTPDELRPLYQELHASGGLKPRQVDSDLGYGYGMTYGETFELPNDMRFGLMLSGGYNKGDSSNTSPVTNPVRSFTRDDYSRGVDWVLFGSGALEMNEHNVIQGTWMRRRASSDDVSKTRQIVDDEENLNYGFHMPNVATGLADSRNNDYGTDFIYEGTAWDINPLSRELEIRQIQGQHALSDRSLRFEWSLTDSESLESRPNSTHFEFGTLNFSSQALAGVIEQNEAIRAAQAVEYARLLGLEDPETYTWETIEGPVRDAGAGALYDRVTRQTTVIPDDDRAPVETLVHARYSGSVPGKQRSTRRTESTNEESTHSQFATYMPIFFNENDEEEFFEFGFGMSKLEKSRQTTARQYDLFIQNNSAVDSGYPGDDTFNGPGGRGEITAGNPNLIGEDFTGDSGTGPFYLNALTDNGLENIFTRLDQTAGFLSGRLEYGDFFLSGGVRYEKEEYEIDIAGSPLAAFTDEQIAANGWEQRDEEEDWLPSVTAGLSTFDDRVNWLVAWSETVARPTFWEFIPSQTFDQANGIGRRGNNTLSPTQISNYDLSISYQATDLWLFRLSLFHKDLVNPLVNFFENGVLFYSDSFLDSNTGQRTPFTATINGVELEAELAELGPFSLRGNFTYIDAVLDYTYVAAGVPTDVSSQLPFQPEQILNLNLGYANEDLGLTANLIYNFTGEYPTVLRRTPEDFEIRREAISTLDLVVSKTFETDHVDWIVRGGIKNIFDTQDVSRYGDQIFRSDDLGRSYYLEVEAKF